MTEKRNVAIIMAFALAFAVVEIANFFFISWKAILSFPMLFLFLRPGELEKFRRKRLVQWCVNCGHKIKAYQQKWKHLNGKIRTQLCLHKNCNCMLPQPVMPIKVVVD